MASTRKALRSDLKDKDLGFAGQTLTPLDRSHKTLNVDGGVNSKQDAVVAVGQNGHRKAVTVAMVLSSH